MYGSNISKWPDELQKNIEEVFISSPELLSFVEEEKEFEDILNIRNYENPSSNLEKKIISSAIEKKNSENILTNLISIIAIPKPAVTLPLLLLLGIAIGFIYTSSFPIESQSNIQENQFAELIYHQEGLYE